MSAMTPIPNHLAETTVTGSGGVAAEGALIPGIPLFINARNSAGFAFNVTFGLLDETDLYLEMPCTVGEAPGAIVQDACAPTSVRHETIAVAGGAPVTLDILTTPHGPTLNAANPALDGFPPLALNWAAAQLDWRVDGLLTLSAADCARHQP
jgi:penicillin G amidase